MSIARDILNQPLMQELRGELQEELVKVVTERQEEFTYKAAEALSLMADLGIGYIVMLRNQNTGVVTIATNLPREVTIESLREMTDHLEGKR